MEYTVTIHAHSRDELIEQIAQLADSWLPEQPPAEHGYNTTAQQNPGTEDDQPELPIEDQPAPEEPEDPEPEPEPEPEPQQAAATKPIDVETLREQVTAYAEKHGNAKAKALVKEWGKISSIPKNKRNEVYEAAGGEL